MFSFMFRQKALISVFAFFIILVTFLPLFSCSKKQEDSGKDKKKETQQEKRVVNGKFLLILGKDYFGREGVPEYIIKEFGSLHSGAEVNILSYADLTINTKKPRLKVIEEKIEQYNPTVIISIGLPEGGGRYLLKQSEDNPFLTVISLLPMDDILMLEAASDIVVDFELPDELLNQEKEFIITDEDLKVLLTAAIFAGEDIRINQKRLSISPLDEFSKVFMQAEETVKGSNKDKHYLIKQYVDPETSLTSRKYLIIYEEFTQQESKKPAE